MDNRGQIWLTRPSADSAKLAAQLAPRPCLVAPLTRIESITPALPHKPDALLLTSRHAASFLAQLPVSWRSLPVYCVGLATARAVQRQHFLHTRTGSGNLMGLLPQLAQLPPGSQLLYLAGEQRRADVAALLQAHQVHVTLCEVYRAATVTKCSPTLLRALSAGEISGVVFYSPRNASLACRLLSDAGLVSTASGIDAFCLSPSVAQAAARLPWRALHSCAVPTSEAMRELIVSHRPLPVL